MSERAAHIRQAQHNEALAKELVVSGYHYRDWSVIASFYAAVHYFEARLHDEPQFTYPEAAVQISHTANSIPKAGRFNRYSPHKWRELLIEHNCSNDTRYAYGQLRFASEMARYHTGKEILSTAHDYFTNQAVDRYVTTYLETVKAGLGFNC